MNVILNAIYLVAAVLVISIIVLALKNFGTEQCECHCAPPKNETMAKYPAVRN